MTQKTSNAERAEWRAKCRERLANHICTHLGISVSPSEVRLIPNDDDPYRWKILPGKEHLFEKHMSKQTKGIYMELWREVGVTFEAVFPSNSRENRDDKHPSFSDQIEELKTENTKLQQDLIQWRQYAESSDIECGRLQTENKDLKQREAQMVELINRYKVITMGSLREAYRAFEDFIPSELGGYLDSNQDCYFS
ncbi:hypothetical protein V8C42DRAFT_337033, partial [Trichoderma barbatum]